MLDFAAQHAAWFVTGSVLSVVASLVLTPWLVIRLPVDYFIHERRQVIEAKQHPLLKVLLVGLKNLAGWILILAGLALFLLPGQGLITLLAGLLITNYPGKFAFERWLVRRPHVLQSMNWLRRRAGCPPLLEPTGDP